MSYRESMWRVVAASLVGLIVVGCANDISLAERPDDAREREAIARAVAKAGSCTNAELIEDDGEVARLDCNRSDGKTSAYITVSANQEVLSVEANRLPKAERPWVRGAYWLVTGPDSPRLAADDMLEEFAAAARAT